MQKYSNLIAACYCRLSDDDEKDGTSVSIETQEKILTDYCRNEGILIYKVYRDDGFTGTNFNRPGFIEMMNDASNKLINTIVVKDLSRFGRNYLKVGAYIGDIFPKMGIRFIAIGDSIDSNHENMDYNFMFPLINIFNEYYPADCSRKTRQAFASKAKNGEYIGAFAAYGLRKSESDKHILEINEETAPIVRRMFEMAANQGYGYNKIARVLSEQKILTPSAYRAKTLKRPYEKDPYDWNLTTVNKILNDKVYIGYFISGRRKKVSFKSKRVINVSEDEWIVIPDAVPQLISTQLWEDAHEKLSSRKRVNHMNFDNIFAGLIKCEACGHALGIANCKNRKVSYSCNTYKKKGPGVCSSHYILFDDLYKAVLMELNKTIKWIQNDKSNFVKYVTYKMDSSKEIESKKNEKEMIHIKVKIDDLDKKFEQLYNDKFSGLISEKKFYDLSVKCEREQNELELQYENLKKQQIVLRKSEECAKQFVKLADQYQTIDKLDREVLNRLISCIVVGARIPNGKGVNQSITIHYKYIGAIS